MSDTRRLEEALRALRDQRAAAARTRSALFAARLAELRQWQSHHVAAFHRRHARTHNGEALLHFLTRTFYLEADWSELTARPISVAGRIGRIVQDHRPLVIAIELQATADALDAAVTQALLAHDHCPPLNARAYVRAFRRVGRAEQRERQIRWIGELVELLGGYADNRAAYWAFKLAGGPARALGLGRTYALLNEGFRSLRATRHLEQATRETVAVQRDLLNRLLGRPRHRVDYRR